MKTLLMNIVPIVITKVKQQTNHNKSNLMNHVNNLRGLTQT